MNPLTWVGVVFTLIAAGTGTVGYFKANVSKSTIELYKEDNEALRTRLTTLEAQAESDKKEISLLQARQTQLTAIVTQAVAIKEMRDVVDRIAVKVGA